jgi:sugar-phosphatase
MSIKAILFDLDGVISDTHLLHYEAYIAAVKKVYNLVVSSELYESMGNIPTRGRTEFLCDKDYILYDKEKVAALHDAKKRNTQHLISEMGRDDNLIDLLHQGKDKYNLKYAVASNASDEFVHEVLKRKEISLFFDSVIGSYSIAKTKPDPLMYNLSMVRLGVAPDECIVVEDSNTGILAGYRSGAYMYRVNGPQDINQGLLDLVGKMQ